MHFLSFLILTTSYLGTVLANKKSFTDVTSLDDVPVLHFTIQRRGGSFDPLNTRNDIANLTYISEELVRVQERYSLTRRKVKGNKLIRKIKEAGIGGGQGDESPLMKPISEAGRW